MIIDAATYGKARVRIQEAAEHLAKAMGNLRERFPNAHSSILRAGSAMPTKQMGKLLNEFEKNLQKVKQGNYDEVKDEELQRAAEIVMELYKLAIIHGESEK